MADDFTSTWWDELDFSGTQGMEAQVWEYVVSHGSLSIRLYQTKGNDLQAGEFYLYCVGCESLPQRTRWSVGNLEARREGDCLIIEDRCESISFRCSSARLFSLRSVLDYWGGGIRREVLFRRNGVTESGDICVFISHGSKPDGPVIAYWLRPIHKEPIPIPVSDTLKGYQRCLSEVAREIDRLQVEGVDVYWKTHGDRCGL